MSSIEKTFIKSVTRQKTTSKGSLLHQLIRLLKPMGEDIYFDIEKNDNVGLYKDKVLFGLIFQGELYLLLNGNNNLFQKIEKDSFLYQDKLYYSGKYYYRISPKTWRKKDSLIKLAIKSYQIARN